MREQGHGPALPDRTQSRRCCDSRGRGRDSRGAGGGDDRRTLRSGSRHASVQRSRRRHPRQPAKSKCRSAGGRSGSSANFWTTSRATSRPSGSLNLRKALLIFHSPTDETVGIDNATAIFVAAKHPKSFVSLAGADHLLSRKEDAAYVANVIAAWAERYLDVPMPMEDVEADAGRSDGHAKPGRANSSRRSAPGRHTLIGGRAGRAGRSRFRAHALRSAAGRARRLHVHDAAALCRSKGAAAGARIRLAQAFAHPRRRLRDLRDQGGQGRPDRPRRSTLTGDLDEEQRKRLLEIADKCPVHRTLTSEIDIRTVEAG